MCENPIAKNMLAAPLSEVAYGVSCSLTHPWGGAYNFWEKLFWDSFSAVSQLRTWITKALYKYCCPWLTTVSLLKQFNLYSPIQVNTGPSLCHKAHPVMYTSKFLQDWYNTLYKHKQIRCFSLLPVTTAHLPYRLTRSISPTSFGTTWSLRML